MSTRHSRQIALPEIGPEGQSRLARASVLVVGVGGLGSPAALYLAAAGVGRITLVDPDRVDESNLGRQVLFARADVGRSKVEAARERLLERAPELAVEARAVALTAENALELVRGHDCVIDGTDNLAARYVLNDACGIVGVPWVYASLFRWEGQLARFDSRVVGACYRCLYPRPAPETRNCSEAGVPGPAVGVLATLQATEALKILLGLPSELSSAVLHFDALSGEFSRFSFARREECPMVTALDPARPEYFRAPACDLASGDGHESWIDVRTREEHAHGAIPGTRCIPLAELPSRLAELPAEPVFYCQSGLRSERAARLVPGSRSAAGGYERWLALRP